MRNTHIDQEAHKYSRPPRPDYNKYTISIAMDPKNQGIYSHHPKNNRDVGGLTHGKENNNPNTKSTRNIQFLLKENPPERQRSRSRSILGRSKAPNMANTFTFAPRESQARSKSRWETKNYRRNSGNNSYSHLNIAGHTNAYLANNARNQYPYTPQAKLENHTPKNDLSYELINPALSTVTYKRQFTHSRSTNNIFGHDKTKPLATTFPCPKIEDDKFLNNTSSFSNNSYDSQNAKPCSYVDTTSSKNHYHSAADMRATTSNHQTVSRCQVFAPVTTPPLLSRNTSAKSEQNKELELEDFLVGQCKGEGRFGKVYMAVHRKSGFLCALKKIKKESVKYMVDQFIQEVKIQMYLNHPKLVKIYGFFADAEYFYMLVQYMEEGSLYSLMKKNKKLDEADTSQKLVEICQGIKQMHSQNIVHRDLKPQNVVLSNGVCKVCDFGWAAICEGRRQTYCGTLDYVCPQIIQGSEYDSSADIWCIGVLAYEMMCGKAPFYDISRKKTMEKIKTCKIQYPTHLSKKAIKFIEMILQKNPDERVGIEELLSSEFLRSAKK